MTGIFEEGRNCWKIENARQASVIIDAENYFRYVRRAMAKAQKRIVLVGWDFDPRIKMHDTEDEPEGPLEIGDYIEWLIDRNPDLNIYILRWDTGAIKSLFRGTTPITLAKWFVHPRIHLKLDSHHPAGAAHHQKIIAIDDDTAFCGGIDITDDRWDTRGHEDNQELREDPDDEDHGPWHDAAMAMQGPVATALSDFAEARWNRAGGKDMVRPGTSDCWPGGLAADFRNVPIAIARTTPDMDDQDEIREIEALYLDIIKTAKHYIYAESQYFASRKIASAIARRLEENNCPEIVVLNPVSTEGWLEPEVMDTKRQSLFTALKERDKHGKFRLYHALNEAGKPIYIHAKIVIADDRILRIGSSNFNNRSLGFDSECDVAIDAGMTGGEVSDTIRSIRNDLLAEHLGKSVDEIEATFQRTGSLIETIQLSRGSGRTLRDYQTPDLNKVEEWLGEHDFMDPDDTDDNFAQSSLS